MDACVTRSGCSALIVHSGASAATDPVSLQPVCDYLGGRPEFVVLETVFHDCLPDPVTGRAAGKFGDELVVFLDRAGYFYARDVWEYVNGKRGPASIMRRSTSAGGRSAGLPLYISVLK